jgi:hypothetical protein
MATKRFTDAEKWKDPFFRKLIKRYENRSGFIY